MKQMVRRHLARIIFVGMCLTLAANYLLQVKLAQRAMNDASDVMFWQIGQILSENEIEAEAIKQDFEEHCLIKAKTAAYIVQNHPSVLGDQDEILKLAQMLQIDELHFFNTDGMIFAGTQPRYWGYHFHSGPQMEFFLPMMEDKTLELCQPITPNTAEGKLMQYAAVWREDGEGIVQIGMEPARVLEATKKNELSYIFSLLTKTSGTELFAADPDTYEILGSTTPDAVGKKLSDVGIDPQEIESGRKGFHATVNGVRSYCNFKEQDSVLLGRVRSAQTLYGTISGNSMLVALYLLSICFIMLVSISRYLDHKIITGIHDVNYKLQNIANGDLHDKVSVHTTTEFTELSGHINDMVKSLLSSTDKLSSVLDAVQIPIGLYEYDPRTGRVQTIGKIPEILALSDEEISLLTEDSTLFEEKLDSIRSCPINDEKTIFHLPEDPSRYLKIDSYVRENSIFGILMDVTDDVKEKKRIRHERDVDVLTGLYNRRAFYSKVEKLFAKPDTLKYAAFLAIDTDHLKQVNDTYGHEAGDHYLRGMADILNSCTAPHNISARLSGDEFELFVYGCENEKELYRYLHILESKQNGAVVLHPKEGLELPVHFSVGGAFYPQDGLDYITLMKCADTRMYEEKRMRHKERE